MSSKRQASSSPGPKDLKRFISTNENGSAVPENGDAYMVSADECESYSSGSSEDDNVSSSVIPSRFTSGFESVEWQKTIENVVKSVVAIRFAQVASFDCDSALVSEATGFVVDAENGIIMTNRHVVGSGPFCGFAVFDNHEEIDVKPIYRDPVHDFGFLQFNPKDIKYMKVSAITLRPDLAKVGCEIRVVGNDAGEKLSILSGFISRLDRNAPDYGFLTYNDFNTEYIQAAASASGGSSGSPVVNMDGFVVALQAGGSSEASTDFFLPLNRGLRALECVQQGKPITRGTIQCQWLLKPFDECRRLGLTSAAEDKMRTKFPNTIGLLLAETVLPEGPSDGLIEEGDCLLEINGEPISKFIRVDEIFDSSVGEEVELLIQRGGIDRIVKVKINDLHAITPDRYVEVAGASFHNLSYQLARLYAIAAKGVYICEAAGSFKLDGSERKGWILDSVDDIPVPDLDTFIEVMKKIPDCKRIPLRYRHIRDLHSINYTIAYINRHWNDTFRLAIRNDETGLWDFTDLGKPLPEVPLQPQIAKFPDMKLENINCASLVKSFVRVSTSVPIKLDGFPKSRKTAYGLVVDAEKGYVVVSRVVVPNDLCDISITIAESVVIPGKVVFLHPLQNYAIVSYDPSLVIAPIQSATLSTVPLKQGTPVIFMGYNHNLRVVATSTRVTDITAVTIPPNAEIPRYRAINVDAITADTTISGQCGSGVLADEDGTVRALWLTYLGETSHEGHDHEYKLGIDITTLQNVIQQLKNGIIPKLRFLDIEVYAIHMVQARIRGVTEEWIRRVEEDNNEQHQLFNVLRVSSGPSAQLLEEGDILLAVNGKVMTRLADLDIMYDKEEVEVMIVRNKQEMIIKVPTVSTEVHETDRVVSWCGTLLQRPHHAVRQQIKKIHSGVYVVGRTQGSPAFQYSIAPTNFITHVNGQETPDLDKFLEVVSSIPDNTYAKLRIVTFDNVPFACSIKTNYHYFPTGELVKNHETGEWEGYSYKDGKKVSE